MKRERNFRLLLDSAAEGIYEIDTEGNCVFCNHAALTMLGYQDMNEVLGKNMHNLIHHSNEDGTPSLVKDCKIFKASNEGGENHVEDEILWTRDGKSFHAEYWSYPIFKRRKLIGSVVTFLDTTERKLAGIALLTSEIRLKGVIEGTPDGQPKRMTGTHSDITERKKMEATLQERESLLRELNASKDKFFSIIAHDLKAPFTTIIGFSDLLLERIRSKEYERIEEFATIIQHSSKQTLNLLSNLLEWARAQTGSIELKLENIEIVSLIDEVVSLFQETAVQKSITITKNLPDHTFLMADKKMIATVIRNLISNAVKFTYPGGVITISIKQNKEGLMVEVKDNGTGISRKNIDKLFRLDVNDSTLGTQNEKGTGLGLLLCNEFIQKHGGRIWVKSKTGTGSTFSFSIPSILP